MSLISNFEATEVMKNWFQHHSFIALRLFYNKSNLYLESLRITEGV